MRFIGRFSRPRNNRRQGVNDGRWPFRDPRLLLSDLSGIMGAFRRLDAPPLRRLRRRNVTAVENRTFSRACIDGRCRLGHVFKGLSFARLETRGRTRHQKRKTGRPAGAATAAFGGIGLMFVFWWYYFEAASAASERRIHGRDDARRFHVWSYAHLPLYLGLALTAVGIEHVVHIGGVSLLGLEGTLILSGGIVMTLAALSVLRFAKVPEETSTPT